MTALLYRWPVAAKFGRTVPKTKFYEHGTVPGAVRDKFVTEVQRITWAYKLAQSTINLPGNADVPEIQIFQIDTKGDDVSESVLAAIDKAVKTPIIFEIVTGEGDEQRVRMAGSHKQAGHATPKLSAYYTTDWQPQDAERQPLPTAISLPSLYTALLAPLTPVSARPGEELSDVAARLQAVRKLEREVASLERKLRAEPQLNRKVELRRALKTKQAELKQQR
ncbi:DUF4391 domain-containing protein [Mycolicibacterium austroafricanum]|uniref:DUF4391 domain-containing protein n=1 Tax=Mycolicibacterium austroafricanum TaxID=39687 RepID=A0ABT8HHX0_MYCAO|nr:MULTISPECIES: DUF4391 domain-containing protein [Mycolicibacterium]MDN4520145.1 DUF4391 domain-containing protein [Mycolicibacterium austroafricanum]UJL30062.1 DUF4391 domain-containing protein [Mycolicibacterium vanbaalenii]UJL30978.1 DUF4391 domain-containing protein [Mycolicibacterium vanbaalenii]WND56870.1 DUF4391 domain-containing protein [Mycolicibacterium vanbaalenii]WND57802.1 DUF4391 domain-containing protein [Mycolicibacterium vanbaalenii]